MEEKTKQKLLCSPLLLAFLGDSVHTLFVRENTLAQFETLGNLASHSARACKAATQANALKSLMPGLTDDELEIVRKARNCKPKHCAKNATSADYSYATAFEALVGYLYLTDKERLDEILQNSLKNGEKDAN